jgi:PKD repeat protein
MSIWIDGARAFTTFTAQADRKFEVKDGPHVIEVQATDINGTVLQATRNLVTQTPDLPPSADLSVTSFSGGAPNQVLACTAGSSDPDDSIASYLVDFGDGINGSGVSLVHTYQNVGTYNVKATVTDSRGTSSTSVQTVTVGSVTSSGAPAPFRLTATPESASAGSGDSATYIIQAISQSGDFSGEVTLSCSGVPAGLACGFDPVQIKPGANGGTSKLVISSLKTASGTRWRMPFSALSLPIFGMTLLASDPRRRKRLRVRFLPLLIFLAALAIFSTSCGGGGSTTISQKTGSTFNITVLGTSGSMQSFTTVQYTLH